MSDQARMDLRLKSKAIPLVVDHEPVTVLYEDPHLVAVAKPAYVKIHPSHRFLGGTLVNRLIGYLGTEPYVLHRLDMHTTGVVLFGKAKAVVAPMSAAFQNRTIDKEYLALVDGDAAAVAAGVADLRGAPPPGGGGAGRPRRKGGGADQAAAAAAADAAATADAAAAAAAAVAAAPPDATHFSVDAPICRDPDVRIARRVDVGDPDGKPALTHFRVLAVNAARTVSLVHCTPVSGRTHQLRVHLRSVGLPIVGDDLYGRERALYASMEELHAASAVPARAKVIDGVAARAGLKLHAWRLHVPATVVAGRAGGEPVVITANPPAELVACADFYGVDLPPREEGGG